MSVGAAPISAYRTLDLPAVRILDILSIDSLSDPPIKALVRAALRATGTGVRLFDPVESREEQVLGRTVAGRQTIEDPALATWLFDAAWVEEQGPWARTFAIWRAEEAPALAWIVAESDATEADVLDDRTGDPRASCASSRKPGRS